MKRNKSQKLLAFLLFAIVLAIFATTSCSKDDDNDENKKEAKSTISQINITKYQYALGERASIGKEYETHIFDANGLLKQSKMYHFGVNDGVEYIIDYKYDNSNRVIEKKDGGFEYTYKYTYTDFDSVAVESKYNTKDGSISERITSSYDEQNRKVKEVVESATFSDLGKTITYEYDGNKVTAVEVYTTTQELFGTHTYEYDNKGNILKVTYINGSTGKESVEDQYEYEYLQDGKIKSYRNYYGLYGDLTKYEYTYNDDNTIKSILVSIGKNPDQYELVYDYLYSN